MKKKTDKTPLENLTTISVVYFLRNPHVYGKFFHGRLLSIRVFSADGHYINTRDYQGNLLINNSRHLTQKYARIFVRGHYLFNCELRGTDNVQGKISEHIFAPNGDYCLYYPSNLFRNARSFENWGIFNN